MHDFLIFYAPVLVVIASLAAAFWVAGKDAAVRK
ncbi:cytochrome bd oxidase small subunit CydS [Neobacillus soli]